MADNNIGKIYWICRFDELVWGTASGTLFEGETWVDDFYNSTTARTAGRVIAKRFNGVFVLSGSTLKQVGEASWAEKFGLISMIRGKFYQCNFKVLLTKANTEDCFENDVPWDTVVYARHRIVDDNKIEMMTGFAPGHPDSDFEWAYAYCDFSGTLLEKFHP